MGVAVRPLGPEQGAAVAGEGAQRVGGLPDLLDLAIGHHGLERLAEPLLRHVLPVRAAGAAVTGRVADEAGSEPFDRGYERQMSQ